MQSDRASVARFVYNRAVRRWHMRALGVVEGGLDKEGAGDEPLGREPELSQRKR